MSTLARLARNIEETFTEFSEADPRFRLARGIHPSLSGKWSSCVPVQTVWERFEGTVALDDFRAALQVSSLSVVLVSIPLDPEGRPVLAGDHVSRPGQDTHCLIYEGWGRPARAPSPQFDRLMQHLKRVRDILAKTGDSTKAFEFTYRRLCGLTERVTVDLELLAGEALDQIEDISAGYDEILACHALSQRTLIQMKIEKRIRIRNLNTILRKINNKNKRIQ